MATKSFYEDLVIDTPEAAENFTRFVEKGKELEVNAPALEDAGPEVYRHIAEKFGYKEL